MELWGFEGKISGPYLQWALLQMRAGPTPSEIRSEDTHTLLRPGEAETDPSPDWPQDFAHMDECVLTNGAIDNGSEGYIDPIRLRIDPDQFTYRGASPTAAATPQDYILPSMWTNFGVTTNFGRFRETAPNGAPRTVQYQSCRIGEASSTTGVQVFLTQGHHRLRLCNNLQAEGIRSDLFFEIPHYRGSTSEEALRIPQRFDPLVCYSAPQEPDHRRRVSVNTMSLGSARPLLDWALRPGGMSTEGVAHTVEYGQFTWNPKNYFWSPTLHSDPDALAFSRGLVQLLQPQLTADASPALTMDNMFKSILLTLGSIAVSAFLGLLTYSHLRNQTKTDKIMTLRQALKIFTSVSRDISAEARAHTLDPVLGRKTEMSQLFEILQANRLTGAQIPALIGERGVGKSALIEGLAQAIEDGELPQFRGWRVVEIDIPSLVAGTGIRGTFEEKMQAIVKVLENTPRTFFFMDEIHMIIGAGKTTDSNIDAAQILKRCLARRGINAVVGTTLEEYKRHIMSDPALESRLTPMQIEQVRAEIRNQIMHRLRTYVIGLSQQIDREAHLTPRKVIFGDDVLNRLSEIIGGNARELKKTLGRLVARARTTAASDSKSLEITHAVLDRVIAEINSARRALGQPEFDLAAHPAPSTIATSLSEELPAASATPPTHATVTTPEPQLPPDSRTPAAPHIEVPWRSIWDTPVNDHIIAETLRRTSPTLYEDWANRIATSGRRFETLGQVIERLEVLDRSAVEQAHTRLTSRTNSVRMAESPSRALFALLETIKDSTNILTHATHSTTDTRNFEERSDEFVRRLEGEGGVETARPMQQHIERERREEMERSGHDTHAQAARTVIGRP